MSAPASAPAARIVPAWLKAFLENRAVDARKRRETEAAFQPELKVWVEENRERADQFTEDELDELFSLRGVGGPLTREGIDMFVKMIESRREVVSMATVVLNTDLAPTLTGIVRVLFEQAQPYRDRT